MLLKSVVSVASFAIAALLSGCVTNTKPVEAPTAQTDRAQKAMRYLTERYQGDGPGAAFIISRKDEYFESGVVGLADIEWNVPIDADTVFRLGSISKTITAVAVLELVEKEMLNLDVAVSAYAPDLPSQIGAVTLRQLMSHRSGLAEHAWNPALLEFIWFPMTTDQIIALEKDKPITFQPGQRYEYVNFNYVVVAHVIEKVTGQSFKDYANNEVFGKLGIANAHYAEHDAIIPRRAEFYDFREERLINAADIDLSHVSAAGALISSLNGFYQWLSMLVTEEIISSDMIDEAWTAKPLPDGTPTQYGLGFNVRSLCGEEIVWHSGLTPGAQAVFGFAPASQTTVIIFTNSFHAPNTSAAMRNVMSILMTGEEGAGWQTPEDANCPIAAD